jgi:CBS domain-containing protein
MKVQDIMTADVESCDPQSDLAAAAMIMWKRDCGSVPVVDNERKVVGMITDRDICMALATRNKLAAAIKVGEVISGRVYACAPDDNIKDALEIMQSAQLRRLPVVADGGTLQGILSLNDVVLHSRRGQSKKHISHGDAMTTLKALAEHRKIDVESDEQTLADGQALAAALI